ncbi:MAG: histidine kinase [Bacteroidales bacterium]|nr:histidine kinase [Bacteroidales bacterium]MDT8429918.1 histidine kinase [Bacteroidales bacterium]
MNAHRIRRCRTIAIHLLFWTAVWFLYYYFFSYNSEDMEYVIWFSSLLVPLTIAVTYFAVYYLIPNYLLKQDYSRFSLFSFYVLVASSYFIVLIIYGCLIFLKKWDATNIPPMMKNFFFVLMLVYLVVVIVGFITVLNHNFKTDRMNKELQNKILTAQLQLKDQELYYLKMQIHPHFLFNTLNTIYGFAIRQSKQTPEIILRLSNLLDYILYQVNKPAVSMKEEVLHIREYVELERIRFQETLRVDIDTSEIADQLLIPPMLLMPFVENAFKHGSIRDGFLRITIVIEVTGNKLSFMIRNTADPEISRGKGIGLENIRKRLDLHYADLYRIDQEQTTSEYIIQLQIDNLMQIKNV